MSIQAIKYICLGAILFYSIDSIAQKDYSAENYYLHEHIIFPASTGVNYYPVLGLTYRKQWTDLPLSPQATIVSTNFRIGQYDFYNPKMLLNKSKYLGKERVGIGLSFKQDKNGPLSTSSFITSYAYHIPFDWGTASLGFDLSYNEIAIDYSELSTIDPNDPSLYDDQSKAKFLQSSVGLQVSNEIFFTTLAARNLFKNNKISESGFIRTRPDYYFYAGVIQSLGSNIVLEPSALVMNCNEQNVLWNANIKMSYKSYNWFSLSYVSSGSIKSNFMLRIIEQIQLGYGYEFYLSNLSKGSYSSHSIFLGRNFGIRNMHGIRKNVKQFFL